MSWGVIHYPVEVLTKLTDFYGVNEDYLLGLTGQKAPYPPV